MREAGLYSNMCYHYHFYHHIRNVYSEKSKADDVQFILDLIAKIGAEIPAANMNDVNIAGI